MPTDKKANGPDACNARAALGNSTALTGLRLTESYHDSLDGAQPVDGLPAPFSFPKDRRPVKLDAALITYTVTRAEQTTGRTRELWLALFRLLCQWWVE